MGHLEVHVRHIEQQSLNNYLLACVDHIFELLIARNEAMMEIFVISIGNEIS